jgi:hypothetical protein
LESRYNPSQILEATESFATDDFGERITVHQGITRVTADHELAKRFPQYFRPVEEGLTYPPVEAATANPGEIRARPSRASKGKEED